jgi:hypothetical protein
MEETIKLKGYLKSSHLDREGSKTVTFEFDASNAIEIAKLELMGRDLNNHLPILLEGEFKQSNEDTKSNSNRTQDTGL